LIYKVIFIVVDMLKDSFNNENFYKD